MTSSTIVDITPDKSLMQKIGAVGYRTEQAISEFIDNAIDARLPGEQERINVALDFVNRTIAVSDDGRGMTLEDLQRALTIAGGRALPGRVLGTFGIGLKSACAALGKSFTIVTSTEGSKVEHVVEYDEDKWVRSKDVDWRNFEVRTRPRTGAHRGTSVVVSRLRVPLYPNQATAFKKIFGVRYGAHLRSGQVQLYVNSKPCHSADPVVKDGSRSDLEIPLPSGDVLRGWIGLLERRSIKGDYGLHLYRSGRLIRAFDKFGMRTHPEVARVVGELHLDHVPVNFYKSGFLVESAEYAECVDAFQRHPDVERAMRSASAGNVPPQSDSVVQSVLDYAGGGAAGAPLPRMGRCRAGRVMREAAASYSTRGAAGSFQVVFEDGPDDDLYKLGAAEPRGGASYRITINRNSPVFRTASNPLFLVGMIRAEAEILALGGGAGGDMAGMVKRRNKLWCRFSRDWSQHPSTPRRPDFPVRRRRPRLIPGYELAAELVEVHDSVAEAFGDPFQFTALSTLAGFLHNAYAKMPYHVVTEKGLGERLSDLVGGHWGGDFVVLYNPSEVEARTAMAVSDKDRFIIVREFSRPVSETWAGPAKAWLDLASECRRAWMAGYRQELSGILEQLIERGLVEESKIRSAARNRRMTGIVDGCIGGAR